MRRVITLYLDENQQSYCTEKYCSRNVRAPVAPGSDKKFSND